MLLRQRINEAARACMLSHSRGSDLDNLAANSNTRRLVIHPATDTTEAVMESDTSLRLRAQSTWDGLSVADRPARMSILPGAQAVLSVMRAPSARHRPRSPSPSCQQTVTAPPVRRY